MERGWDVLDMARAEHNPRGFYALFSGGHDSLTATGTAFAWAKERGVTMWAAHINTGTGVPQTSEFVRSVCRDNGWPLREVKPPRSYESLVMEFGFPGPGQHGLMYQRLKERCLRQLIREAKKDRSDRVMFVTGVRSQESVRRMKHVERIQREGATVWAAPIHDWSKSECRHYIEAEGLPFNEVVDVMHMSGECRCGAFAHPGELEEWMAWYPEETAWIAELEKKVEAAGLRACRWGHGGALLHVHQDQMKLDEVGPLCQGCELRAAA